MRYRWMQLSLSLAVVAAPARGQRVLDERVLPREVADEVLRVWNAPGTLRVTGAYTVDAGGSVRSDIGVLGGPLVVSGRVTGGIVAVNADVQLTKEAVVDGDILVVGGEVTGRDLATVTGQIRVYRARLDYTREGDRLVQRPDDDEGSRWWRRRERWRERSWSDLRLVSARTYNRVEGLPLFLGPTFGRDMGWARLSMDAYGVFRTIGGFTWKSENVGHSLKTDLRLGNRRGMRVGARLFNLVEPVEAWQLSDAEVGLASLFLHRDFRDYYNKHGGSVYASLFRGSSFDATVSFSDQRWADRRTGDPWTIVRGDESWRENPILDEGSFHLLNGTLRYDTRNDEGNPWSGWYILTDYELGTGQVSRYGLATPGTRSETLDGLTTYDRLFVDVRRYNRISPDAQFNVRLVAGGWLSGDDLPMQRRFSVGGPGTLPGYDFRRTAGTLDVFQCTPASTRNGARPLGTPAECERFAMAQVEFRGDMHLDPFGVLDEERDRRRAGWGRGAEWVLFADAGRGWLVGERDGGLSYPKDELPRLSTFRTDVGVGLVLDKFGVYVAKSLTDRRAPVNVFVRLKPRF